MTFFIRAIIAGWTMTSSAYRKNSNPKLEIRNKI
jgi:hypothetical protein